MKKEALIWFYGLSEEKKEELIKKYKLVLKSENIEEVYKKEVLPNPENNPKG